MRRWNYNRIQDIEEAVMGIQRKHNEQFDAIAITLGRVGFVARGFVWACIGGVAASAAFTGKSSKGATGALGVVARSNGGFTFFILATLGMFCYAGWRFFEGFYGLRVSPTDKKWKRLINGYIVPFTSCGIYIAFAISNIYVMVHGRMNSNSSITGDIAKNVAGKILLNIASVILCGVAFAWLGQLIKGTFKEVLDQDKFNKQIRLLRWVVLGTGYLGILGRIILFLLLAVLLFRTSWDPDIRTSGFGGALNQLQVNIVGQVFLMVVAVLLVIFGVWSVFNSYFKLFLFYDPRILTPDQRARIRGKWEQTKDKMQKLSDKSTTKENPPKQMPMPEDVPPTVMEIPPSELPFGQA